MISALRSLISFSASCFRRKRFVLALEKGFFLQLFRLGQRILNKFFALRLEIRFFGFDKLFPQQKTDCNTCCQIPPDNSAKRFERNFHGIHPII